MHWAVVLTLSVSSGQPLKLERVVERDAEISHVFGLSDDTLLTEDVVYPKNLCKKRRSKPRKTHY